MGVREQLGAAVWSLLRVFGAALGAAVSAQWAATPDHDVLSWGWSGAAAFGLAVLLTAANAVRVGDTRFGRGKHVRGGGD